MTQPGARIANVKKVDLFSQEWCSLIFQNRNQAYGAYRLRQEAGKRYRRALLLLMLFVLLAFGVPFGVHLYMRYQLYKALVDFQKEIPALKRKEAVEGHELKQVATGRARPTKTTIKDAANDVPELVEDTKKDIVFGPPGEETFIAEDLSWSELEDMAPEHNQDQLDLPIEGPHLTPVDVVEEMPQFPGGIPALMEWLSSNIPYPRRLQESRVAGDMEVTFLVDREGRLSEVRITKSLHPDLDKLVLAAMKRMPLWKPGRSGGQLCLVSVALPIHFEPGPKG